MTPSVSDHGSGPSRATRALQAAGRLVSTTLEIDAKLLPEPVRAAGYDGRRLWSRADAGLLALGEALRLPLPASWAAPERTSLVAESPVGCHGSRRPRASRLRAGRHGGAPLRPGRWRAPGGPPPRPRPPQRHELGHAHRAARRAQHLRCVAPLRTN